jgi:probable phosphoglycerate mutase
VIILVRHGQTAANAEGRLQGRTDRDLSDEGQAQAAALAAALAASGATRVMSSPLRRAAQTAAPIATALGLAVEVEPDLIELDYGRWDDRPIAAIDPADWARWRSDVAFAPPGGESLLTVHARVERWLRTVLGSSDTIVAVSHVSPIKAAVCVALGVDDAASWRMHLATASICRLARRQGGVVLASFNETLSR